MSFKKVRIGRSRENDVVIDHPSVSRVHLEFFYDEEGNVFLTDLNSSNGTFVNGNRIYGSVQLKPSDIVKAGLADPIPWRNYGLKSDKNDQRIYTHDVSSHKVVHRSGKKGGSLKVVGITLGAALGLVAIFFVLNEFVFSEVKPLEVDPDKPNTDDPQPHKKQEEEKKVINYDFTCLEDEEDMGSTDLINVFESIDSQVTEAVGGEVTIKEEEEVGDQLLKDCRKEYKFITSGKKIENLSAILNRLVKEIKDPKGYHYSIYLIDSDQLNAFTAGAKIFVTTRMYSFCNSNDELACVIGHEINHNELGHIKQFIQKSKILTEQGAALAQMATISFGQKKETHCDLTGIDLVIAAGYDGCVNIGLWKRMKTEADEGDYNAFENLFRSHPYSEKRANCSHNHIVKNYGFDCDSKRNVE